MTTERDTHFQNAAKLLWKRLTSADTGNFADSIDIADASPYEQAIAQFAYDLVLHAFQQYWISHNPEWDVQRTPDLTVWPTDPGTS